MTRVALENVAVDRLRLQGMQLTRELAEARRRLLDWVKSVLAAVDLGQRVCLVDGRREMTSRVWPPHSLIGECHVDQGLLVVVSVVMVHLFPLQLVLDPFAVWCVAYQGQDRTNPFNQQCPLGRFGIIKGSLKFLSI